MSNRVPLSACQKISLQCFSYDLEDSMQDCWMSRYYCMQDCWVSQYNCMQDCWMSRYYCMQGCWMAGRYCVQDCWMSRYYRMQFIIEMSFSGAVSSKLRASKAELTPRERCFTESCFKICLQIITQFTTCYFWFGEVILRPCHWTRATPFYYSL